MGNEGEEREAHTCTGCFCQSRENNLATYVLQRLDWPCEGPIDKDAVVLVLPLEEVHAEVAGGGHVPQHRGEDPGKLVGGLNLEFHKLLILKTCIFLTHTSSSLTRKCLTPLLVVKTGAFDRSAEGKHNKFLSYVGKQKSDFGLQEGIPPPWSPLRPRMILVHLCCKIPKKGVGIFCLSCVDTKSATAWRWNEGCCFLTPQYLEWPLALHHYPESGALQIRPPRLEAPVHSGEDRHSPTIAAKNGKDILHNDTIDLGGKQLWLWD